MKDAREEILAALGILGTLSVSGEAVEAMAAARYKLKRAAALLEDKEDEHGG